MKNTYYISTNPEFYGSDASEDEAESFAEIVAKHAIAAYPSVEFVVSDRRRHSFEDDELLEEVQQYINNNFADWIAESAE